MATTTNEQVVRAWLTGQVAASRHLQTDGEKLFSYQLLIGDRYRGVPRIWNYTASGVYRSQTTSCHVGLARNLSRNAILMKPS
jgi:hypothetical protein